MSSENRFHLFLSFSLSLSPSLFGVGNISCVIETGCREVPGEQLLIGRRFMDQLRAPARASGRAASIMTGPRGKTSEEEEAKGGQRQKRS